MVDQQSRTPLQSKAEEPNDKISRSVGEKFQSPVKNKQKENQDNESKASSDQKIRKAEKPAALEKSLIPRGVWGKSKLN